MWKFIFSKMNIGTKKIDGKEKNAYNILKIGGRNMEEMETMGMTDNQWKDNLRGQLENWEDVEELIKSGKADEALKKIEKVKARINKGLED